MAVRHNTAVCSFDPSSPRITQCEIHEWFHAALRVQESKVSMIHNYGIKQKNFNKFVDNGSVHALIRDTSGRAEYKYSNAELSIVNIDMAGMGTKHIRVANTYAEKWSNIYRYPASNGVQQVVMHLTRHLPSHLTTAGRRVLISCKGCGYGCSETRYLCQSYPERQATGTERQVPPKITYASVVKKPHPPAGQ